MKSIIKYMLAMGVMATASAGCSMLEVPSQLDTNNPIADNYLKNATRSQLKELFVGMQARLRAGFAGGSTGYTTIITSFGREGMYYSAQDGRYIATLLGTAPLDNSSFYHGYYTTFAYARNQAAQAELAAVNALPGALTAGELKAYQGYAKTLQAICQLHHLNMLYQNGIRIDLANPLKPGPFVSYQAALTDILRLLNEGYALLSAADADMSSTSLFFFTTGWNDYLTANTSGSVALEIGQVNRAYAARVYAYRACATNSAADWNAVLTAVDNSFYSDADAPTAGDFNAKRNLGPRNFFSAAAGEATNPQFYAADRTSGLVLVPNSFIDDAETGDTRVFNAGTRVVATAIADGGTGKIRRRSTPLATLTNSVSITFNYEIGLYPTNTTPSYMIRGEELALLAAEAKYNTGLEGDAQAIINVVRAHYTLGAVTPTGTALRDEILKQRRYSLVFEGHRWIDLRRYNLLNAAWVASVLDDSNNPYGAVVTQMPKRIEEINWDNAN